MGHRSRILSIAIFPLALPCLLLLLQPRLSPAQDFKTTIDTSYTYTMEKKEGEVIKSRELQEKYSLDYLAFLGFNYEFTGKLLFEYNVNRKTEEPDEKRQKPSLDLKMKSNKLELSLSYDGQKNQTDRIESTPGSTSYSNSYLVNLTAKPQLLPQTKFKWERKKEFEPSILRRQVDKYNLQLVYDWGNLGSDFKYSKSVDRNIMPDEDKTRDVTWEGNLDYGRRISRMLDLQAEYNVKETSTTATGRNGVFQSLEKDYKQKVRSSLKSNYEFLRGFTSNLSYDFTYEQDFEKEDFDHKYEHKFTAGLSKELLAWAALDLRYEGTDQKTVAAPRDETDDTEMVKNLATATLRWKPWDWLDGENKGEESWESEIVDGTGRSIDRKKTRKMENTVNFQFIENLKINASQAYEESLENGLMESKDTKCKFKVTYVPFPIIKVDSSYEISLAKDFSTDTGRSILDTTTRIRDAILKFSFDKKLLDLFQLKAERNFGYKITQDLEEFFEIDEETVFSDETKLSLKISGFVRGMSLDTAFSRKMKDTKEDNEPPLTDKTLSIKWDWKVTTWTFTSSYKFDDKGDANDTLKWDTKVSWKKEFWEIVGEYSYDRTFKEKIDETKKYNIKFKLSF